MKKVTVLGSKGMLGSMVARCLVEAGRFRVEALDRSALDAEKFVDGQQGMGVRLGDYVINCIGIIKPFCKDNDPAGVLRAIKVNAVFPHRLAAECRRSGARLIQIATDCVYSGTRGGYVESDPHDALDVYGKTKSLGEVFDGSMLNVRCSIIGPEEKKNKASLLEWVLAHPDGAQVNGFAHHVWNGVTTLQFAQLCERIIDDQAYDALVQAAPLHHFVPNETVTKYELVQLISEVYGKGFNVRRVDDAGPAVDRTLATKLPHLAELMRPKAMRAALTELRDYSRRARRTAATQLA